jgi:hypothetical protein
MRSILLPLACAVLVFGCAKSFEHDPKLAAQRAEEFARVVFIKRDFDTGYTLLADSARRYVPPEKFRETVVKAHPKSYPNNIAATDYEPMSGEKAIYVYLSGVNDGERFNYTLTLDGTAASDYKVMRFSRSGAGAASRQSLIR